MPDSERPAQESRHRLVSWGAALWGLVLSCVLCQTFFSFQHGQFFENHDGHGYGLRLIEFRDCLRSGVIFPQWCFHFRGGLGAPFFNYYQPGFFYVSSLMPASLPVAWQLGGALLGYSLAGYCGMLSLLARRFSVAAGMLAGTFLLTAPYVHTELYIRGDFSGFGAMMLVPGFLAALLRFCEQPSRGSGCLGAALAALIVMTHPAIALALYGLLAVVFAIWSLTRWSLSWALRGGLLLAFGAGLSAFYWLPVFLESRYSSVEKMWDGQIFDGYYQYSRHFLRLSWLFDRSVTPTPIPVKLGWWHLLVTGAGLLVVVSQWKHWDVTRRSLAGLCLILLGANLFLMSPQSQWLWETLPLLERVQFPWRLLSLVSVSMAGLAGMSLPSLERRGLCFCGLALVCGLLTWQAATRPRPAATRHLEPRTASELADQFFAPDLADEWLPRDATSLRVDPRTIKVLSTPPAEASDFRLEQGSLQCRLRTRQASSVVLPHYYFPIGFTASLNGDAIPIGRTTTGLMQFQIPANFSGELRVVWQTTPAKRQGTMISLAFAAAGLLVAVGWHALSPRRA